MVILFGGESQEKLYLLRLNIFYRKVAGSVSIKTSELVPLKAMKTLRDIAWVILHNFGS